MRTRSFFNGYFNQQISINATTYDAVNGFFRQRLKSKEAANALTSAILTTSFNNKIDPLALIEDLKQVSDIALDETLALLLNETRRNTSLLGVAQPVQINQNIARNILA